MLTAAQSLAERIAEFLIDQNVILDDDEDLNALTIGDQTIDLIELSERILDLRHLGRNRQ